MNAIVVLVTAPEEKASWLAERLLEERLAACCSILGPADSLFWWQGALCREREALLMIKTTLERFEALREKVLRLHPYEVPEIIALPIIAGHPPYLEWLTQSVEPRESC